MRLNTLELNGWSLTLIFTFFWTGLANLGFADFEASPPAFLFAFRNLPFCLESLVLVGLFFSSLFCFKLGFCDVILSILFIKSDKNKASSFFSPAVEYIRTPRRRPLEIMVLAWSLKAK